MGYNLRSIVCVPLKFKGAVTGVIYVDNRIRTGLFTESERDLLAAFGNQAAMYQGPWPRGYQGPMPPNPMAQAPMMPMMPVRVPVPPGPVSVVRRCVVIKFLMAAISFFKRSLNFAMKWSASKGISSRRSRRGGM